MVKTVPNPDQNNELLEKLRRLLLEELLKHDLNEKCAIYIGGKYTYREMVVRVTEGDYVDICGMMVWMVINIKH